MSNFQTIFLIMGLGALGATLRYLVHIVMLSTQFPWSTLVVNSLGSFIMGYVYTLYLESTSIWPSVIMIGFLGAFTTYSSFSLDTLKLFQQGAFGLAGLNILANNIVCIALCYLGLKVGQVLAVS